MTQETTLHGNFVSIFSVGTLITGKPGSGKSNLALSLIDRGHQLIADDAPFFTRIDNQIIGKNPLPHHLLFVRGVGMLDVNLLFGTAATKNVAELRLIINLEAVTQDDSYPYEEKVTKDVLGCLIPCVTIPIIQPRNLEVLVETIVKKYLLNLNQDWLDAVHLEALSNKSRQSHS